LKEENSKEGCGCWRMWGFLDGGGFVEERGDEIVGGEGFFFDFGGVG